MSGPIRQVLGPAKARTKGLIEKEPAQWQDVPNQPLSVKLQSISEVRIKLKFDIEKLQNAVNLLISKDRDWCSLMQNSSLKGEDREKEEKLYGATIESEDGHFAWINKGQDRISELKCMVLELDYLHESTERLSNQEQLRSSIQSPSFDSPAVSHVSQRPALKLPKLELQKFNGDSLQWKSYWDSFAASVDSQPISKVQKFSYLSGSCVGQAAAAIRGLAITEDNYTVAVDLLKKRFGDPEIVVRSLYSKLRGLRSPPSGNAKELRKFFDEFESVLRQLESAGENSEQSGLVDLIRGKLPADVLLEMQKSKPAQRSWSMDLVRTQLANFVETQEEVLRIANLSLVNKGAGGNGGNRCTETKITPNRSNPPHVEDSSSSAASMGIGATGGGSGSVSSKCAFCDGSHPSSQCSVFVTVEERKAALAKKGLVCYRCLKPNHSVPKCKSKYRCKNCKNRGHNHALCTQSTSKQQSQQRYTQRTQYQKPRTQTPDSTSAHSAGAEPVADNGENSVSMGPSLTSSDSKSPAGRKVRTSLLHTARTKLQNSADPQNLIKVSAQLFLDNGAQRSFITKSMAKALNLLPEETEELSLYTFNSETPKHEETDVVQFEIVLRDGSTKRINANAMSHLTCKQERQPLSEQDMQFVASSFEPSYFADVLPSEKKVFLPDVIIGQDYYWDFILDKPKIKLPSGMYAIPSSLGLLLGGKQEFLVPKAKADQGQHSVVVKIGMHQALAELNLYSEPDFEPIKPNLEDFWSLESVGVTDPPDENEDDAAVQHFNDTVIFQDGRYYVKWPWKSDTPQLPDNKLLAWKRFGFLLKRFRQDLPLLEKCSKVIDDQHGKQIVEIVYEDILDGRLFHYLPHHPVITPQKITTKVRIVFDGSAHYPGYLSLNDCLYRGQVLLPDLCGLLLRFRMYAIAIGSDLEKAFLQLCLQDEDRDVTRFFWFKDPTRPELPLEENVQIYRFQRVCFGIKPSPFLLEVTLKYHLNRENSPTAQLIAKNTYVDNVIVGVDSIEEAVSFYHESKAIFKRASMNLREFVSNSEELMSHIPSSDKIEGTTAKILGLKWNIKKDTLTVTSPQTVAEKLTKRSIMKMVASIFDPFGLLAPAVLPGKLLIQSLWKEKLGWDEELPIEFADQWKNIQDGFEDISFPRYVGFSPTADTELHHFVDASSKAFAAVSYLRQRVDGSWKVHILFSKSRLAPAKQKVTMPRLELLGNLIGIRMMIFVLKELEFPALRQCVLRTDSECCLHWLKTTKPLARFVENRVKDIKKLQSSVPGSMSFNYVPGSDNPADLATRGLTFSELKQESLWWNGPDWLQQDTFPQWNIPPVSKEVLQQIEMEVKKSAQPKGIELGVSVALNLFDQIPFKLERFSSLKKLLNSTVYVFRFLKRVLWKFVSKNVEQKFVFLSELMERIQEKGPILCKELKSARCFWDLSVQHQHFSEVCEALQSSGAKEPKFPSMIKQLGVYQDSMGVLRCQGRLKNAPLTDEAKSPKLLPKDHHYTKLVVLDVHLWSSGEFQFHCGVQQTLAAVRKEYWIPQGRSFVRKILHGCTGCKKLHGGPFGLPKMPALPVNRVTRAHPFEFSGLDYLGPVWYKFNGEKLKAWISLFTCLVTRAIHLELVLDMTAQQFLNALRRFIARRGPKKIMSDNAAQFKLVSDTVRKAWQEMVTDDDVVSYCSSQSIEWQFITPLAPWQGGVYERMVGIVKTSFKHAVGRKMLEFSQLTTLVAEIEAVVNCRPLTYIYDDVNSTQVLRPVDFLQSSGSVGSPDFDEDPNDPEYRPKLDAADKLLKFWKTSQTELDKFWDFFQDEYLASLRERTKVDHTKPKGAVTSFPKKDDVVLVHEEMVPRGSWKLGRIQKLNSSHDGQIRSAEVLMPNKSVLARPINKLYPVEVAMVSVPPENQGESHQQESLKKKSSAGGACSSFQSNFLSVLTVCLILFGVADCLKIHRTYVMCSGGRTGHALHVPTKIDCRLPERTALQRTSVKLWVQRDQPMKAVAFRCYLQHHHIYTRTGFLWSKGIVGDVVKYSSVSPHDCQVAVQRKTWQSSKLVEISSGLWFTNRTLIVAYRWCCYDVENKVTNFHIEAGEVASLDGKKAVTDLDDISPCKPDAGFCRSSNAVVIWNGTNFESQCSFKVQGVFQATLSGYSLICEDIQGAFSFSGKRHPVDAECVPEHAFYTDQGGVFVEFLRGIPAKWLNITTKQHLQEKAEYLQFSQEDYKKLFRQDLSNYKRLFLYKKLVQIERQQFSLIWHQFCLLKQGQLNLALQLLRIDATLGVRSLVGRDDIYAEWNGEVIQVWTCRNVTPEIIHASGTVNGTCYMYTPVQLKSGSPLLFVSPGSRDLIGSSPSEDCGHATPHIFKGDDGQFYTVHGLVHVTKMPLEIHWKGLWDVFTFDAPSLFHNKFATLFSAFYQPRFDSLRLYKLEQMMDRMVNYTASMSLDPEVISQSISGIGKGVGYILSGAGDGIGHLVHGVTCGIGSFFGDLLKQPLQVLLNVIVIGAVSIGVLFLLWKIPIPWKKIFAKKIRSRFSRQGPKESCEESDPSNVEIEMVPFVPDSEEKESGYQMHFKPSTAT